MSMEQRQEQREGRCATNNQCSDIERENRDLLEGGTWIGLDKKGKIMKMHRKGWLLQSMTSYSWLSVLFIFQA